MAKGFYNDYEERLLGEGTDTKYEEDPRTDNIPGAEEFYDLPHAVKLRKKTWAIISLVAGILSVLLCSIYYVSFAFAAISIGATLISRHNLGFFIKPSVMGIIFGIMGFVCAVFVLIANMIGLF